ncbi:unnamed protein product [Rotaria sp. Silwood1]|nr:unnamed protein product [Rotaria sp. Silwood1]CAF1624472.1 unnamed protein product [Rotaria sp. Silwood1]CAF3771111.1 unnamed protein product [Rotaria sp. Silwood1]CAF4733973.1 unnamed protein product [Rotaria sp. Silwood1]
MIISANNRPIIQRLITLSSSILNYSTKTTNKFKLPSYTSESNSQLIKLFNNRGEYERAFQLFDILIKQNNVTTISLLTIIDTCTRSNHIERGRQIETFINQSSKWKDDIRLQTSLIKMYMKCQMIDQAERIFQKISQLPECDVVVYNAMLKGYLQNHKAEYCFSYVDKMRSKISPDNVTYILLLNACTILRDEKRGKTIHNELLSSLNIQHVHLQNALIDFYGKINQINIAEKIFYEMNLRETSTYNSLMKAYLVNNMPLKVLELFEQMKQIDLNTIGPLNFKPDLITFMAICDACEKLGLLNSPNSSYEQYDWKRIFSRISTTVK